MAGWLAFWPKLRLHDRILQHAEGSDAGGEGLDVGLRVRHLAHVLRRLLQLVQRNKHNVLARCGDFASVTHGLSPLVMGFCAAPAHEPLPVGETGGSKRKEAPNAKRRGSARGAPCRRRKKAWGDVRRRRECLDALRARGAEPLSHETTRQLLCACARAGQYSLGSMMTLSVQ